MVEDLRLVTRDFGLPGHACIWRSSSVHASRSTSFSLVESSMMTGSDLKDVVAEDGHALALEGIDQRLRCPAYTGETRQ